MSNDIMPYEEWRNRERDDLSKLWKLSNFPYSPDLMNQLGPLEHRRRKNSTVPPNWYIVPRNLTRTVLLNILGGLGVPLMDNKLSPYSHLHRSDFPGQNLRTTDDIVQCQLSLVSAKPDMTRTTMPVGMPTDEKILWWQNQGAADIATVELTLYLTARACQRRGVEIVKNEINDIVREYGPWWMACSNRSFRAQHELLAVAWSKKGRLFVDETPPGELPDTPIWTKSALPYYPVRLPPT